MQRRSTGLVSAAFVLLTACSGGTLTVPTGVPVRATSTRAALTGAATTGPGETEVDVCALVSLGDVQAISPFSVALETAEPNGSPAVCLYDNWHGTSTVPVSITILVTTFASPADATGEFHNREKDERNLNVPVSPITGVGDAASAFLAADEVSALALAGSRVINVRCKGQTPDLDPAKPAANVKLLKLVIPRLP